TTDANDSMRPVHSRMPVIVRPEEIRTWIMDDSAYPAILHREQAPLVSESDDGELLLLAGIFREEPDGRKYTILTTDANDSMRPVHSRMPVIVRPEEIRTWILDDSAYPAILHREQAPLVRESDDGQMMLDLGI
ncbi:MAG: SOS response-associated peptidase family protein, partial [Eubacterium sp.]|nr:SOS response-associated peptidase family protein [Eubacterium sp.]